MIVKLVCNHAYYNFLISKVRYHYCSI